MSVEQTVVPLIPASKSLPEITIRAVVLSIILVVILGAANAYLGFKIGLTVSASIPAAVISMSVLRWFKNSNVLENSIVQTTASAGECLASGLIYTLPALILLHFYTDFNYWQTVVIGCMGGTFGVLFAVPIRRAVLNDRNLTFPEGLAIGNVLKASVNSKMGMAPLIQGGAIGAAVSFLQSGFEIFSDHISLLAIRTHSVFGFTLGFTPAMIAAGYIVGINITIGIIIGMGIAWGILMPLFSHFYVAAPGQTAAQIASIIFVSKIKYIGLGSYLVGGLWTFINLTKPLLKGMNSSLRSNKSGTQSAAIPRTERDIPFKIIIWVGILMLIPLYFLLTDILQDSHLIVNSGLQTSMTLIGITLCIVCGFVLAAVCAYFAGLVGSSTSPVSGAFLIMLIVTAVIFSVILKHVVDLSDPVILMHAAAYTILITAIVATMGSISNDTMQDMKSGQIVGSTPWKQQVFLILGCLVSALILPMIMKLLFNAYGMGNIFPHPGMNHANALSAPQATLVAAVAQGIFSGQLPWGLISLGAGITVVFIFIDAGLKRRGLRLPALAISMGIYLPTAINSALIMGGILSYIVHRKSKSLPPAQRESGEQNATLFACGTVAGSALIGVVLAIPFVIFSSSDALKIMPDNLTWLADILGVLGIAFLLAWMYRTSRK
jgi:putative OPT family oligopeptide transporter